MGRDFKIGLVCGLIPAVAALIWLATRPSFSPEARMMRSSQALSPAEGWTPQATEGAVTPISASRVAYPSADGREGTATLATAIESTPNPQPPTNLPDLTIYERSEKIKTTRFHIVRKNETLSSISQQYFGSPSQWRKILEANRNVVPDANKLQPGTKLIIPE